MSKQRPDYIYVDADGIRYPGLAGLSVRSAGMLSQAGKTTPEQVSELSANQIKSLPCGPHKKSAIEIAEWLEERGLQLRGDN